VTVNPTVENRERRRRIVVKVGTSTLTSGSGRLSPPRMIDLVRQIAELRAGGAEVILVTSGAQQAGRERLAQQSEQPTIPFKQMLAAVGQGRLMHLWEQYFDYYDIVVAQVLLTRQDIEDRRRYLSVRDTFDSLINASIVPIINENDAVATDEIKVGENDSLSAMVATLIEADLLILLTDTDGLFTADPNADPNAQFLESVPHIDPSIYELATGSRSGLGTGGMYTKIVAADIAVRCGTSVVIANGSRPNILPEIVARRVRGTWFPAAITPREGRKRWLTAQTMSSHLVIVDDGAANAISRGGKSLLPVGIVGVEGEFERGAIIRVRTRDGREIARGLGNYSAQDLRRILGARSGDIAELLGYDYGPHFIHRDKMALVS
jgi:glutamate 5-kinase